MSVYNSLLRICIRDVNKSFCSVTMYYSEHAPCFSLVAWAATLTYPKFSSHNVAILCGTCRIIRISLTSLSSTGYFVCGRQKGVEVNPLVAFWLAL